MPHPDFLHRRLAELREAGTYRELPGTREGVDFWSNDYLGFSREMSGGTADFNTAPGSRLISGDSFAISQLETRIADFHGYPAALLFSSGYTANLGLLSCIARRTDTIVYDELIHASIRDGIRLSGAAARRCQHNKVEQAHRVLSEARSDGQTFFVTEARFSMDGDTAPLRAIAEACQEHGAHLIVDEAHSIGIDGPRGSGLTAELGLQQQVFASVVTYGKAPGASGAAVLGGTALRNYLVNLSRPFIFTTAPRPEQLASIMRAYELLGERQSAARGALENIITYFGDSVTDRDLATCCPLLEGPIQLVHTAGRVDVMTLEHELRERGILVKGIRPPSVPRGADRIRICLHAFNTREEVDRLTDALRDCLATDRV
ncbi:aminotransferase class I/II-fold pyridoxal phosphate-dependent enzyme [Lewinella sp. JB7]|uniref:aminotransferase class I/II-fold pyridoxal phosphate-dependent enzyme n=1 Tax=Lewinella sp. JB7 TaxID=2962887 RepID=UPI0020C94EB5|nr:aminotransferase class I/II-fold pyridoxal phosphate-dependent enzyme [Lewinella sp. JB7]MCP9235126.1 aminotransferase class I/II-fold pyridoxal phosphate-dependent enzyme [Lewinella sp. JB7]